MITHAVSVEVVHLFLYRTIDAGVTRMQAHDELSLVVELFHQCKLFFQIHGSGAADCCARFGAKCQFAGHEAACIEDEVCLSNIARPRTEIRSGSPGPAPTISMCPRRWAQMSRVAATV